MPDEPSFEIEERARAEHPGGRYVVLFFEDAGMAQTLIDDMGEYPGSDILTPALENNVHARVVAVWGVRESK